MTQGLRLRRLRDKVYTSRSVEVRRPAE
ncbi:DE-cadherin like protein, partial [Danaus plexippus plexippus]